MEEFSRIPQFFHEERVFLEVKVMRNIPYYHPLHDQLLAEPHILCLRTRWFNQQNFKALKNLLELHIQWTWSQNATLRPANKNARCNRKCLVALYFACKSANENSDTNGEVFCFKVAEKDVHSAYSVYANVAASICTEISSNIEDFVRRIRYEAFSSDLRENLFRKLQTYSKHIIATFFHITRNSPKEKKDNKQLFYCSLTAYMSI